mmetsp:Transcript_24977/g.69931  ORF Transcript_24977/g.69931 Transcript_24977/m.69931 type:complete len:264 (-) Transcript_24977:764-1555(-)
MEYSCCGAGSAESLPFTALPMRDSCISPSASPSPCNIIADLSSLIRMESRKGVRPGVDAGVPAGVARGVSPLLSPACLREGVATTFGVACTARAGVMPEKSDGCRGVFSPPLRGVWAEVRAIRFSASRLTTSSRRGVRATARGVTPGVAPYDGKSIRVAAEPSPASSTASMEFSLAISSNSMSLICGLGSSILVYLRTASGSLSRLTCIIISGRLDSRRRFCFSASRFRSRCSSTSRRFSLSFDRLTRWNGTGAIFSSSGPVA